MNKKTLIIGVILLLLLVGGALVFSKKSVAPQKDNGEKMVKQAKPADTQSAMMSLSELLTSGKTQSCSYDYTDDTTGKMSGKVYISGGKMRSDYSITDKTGKETTGSVINDGTNMYMWSSSMAEGIKIAVTEEMKKDMANAQGKAAKYVDMNKKVNYHCDVWTLNTTSFVPPTNVKFTDYSAMMKQAQEMQKAQQSSSGAQDMKATQ
jgi:hypothetical protein